MGFLALAAPLLAGTAGAGAAASVATGATMAGAGLGAAGALMGGVSAMGQANYQASIAKQNAAAAQAQAGMDLRAGQTAESEGKLKVGATVGAQRAAQAANGVDVGVGSAAQIQQSTRDQGTFDAAITRYNAERAAYGQNVQATSDLAQAKMDKASGRNALIGSFIGAASSTLGGLGKVASYAGQNTTAGVGS